MEAKEDRRAERGGDEILETKARSGQLMAEALMAYCFISCMRNIELWTDGDVQLLCL